jgi:uncharacterized membrane protein
MAVVAFLGNIAIGVFWEAHAARTKDTRLIAHVMEGIIRADRWFTNPGALLIVVFGVAAAIVGHLPIMRTHWILGGIVLMTVSGAIFGMRLVPLQRRMLEAARAGDLDGYERHARPWKFWGAIALIAPLLAMVLMVLKPAF